MVIDWCEKNIGIIWTAGSGIGNGRGDSGGSGIGNGSCGIMVSWVKVMEKLGEQTRAVMGPAWTPGQRGTTRAAEGFAGG